MNALFTRLAIGIVCGGFLACSSSNDTTSPGGGGSGSGDAQTPPTTNGTDVEAWIKTGQYKKWHCETAPHDGRSPTVHGVNRICSNDAIATNATSTAAWPKGAAAVKELYNAVTDAAPVGYAVYVKTAADSAAGASWYYYERTGDGTVFADGLGSAGQAKTICVACHSAAGSDQAHTPSPGGHDFVYTPVH